MKTKTPTIDLMKCHVKIGSVERKCIDQIRKAMCLKKSDSDGELYCPYDTQNHATLMKVYGWLLCYYKGDEIKANVGACCVDMHLKYHFNIISAKNDWGVKLE